ncbi:uncharacterized protein LOC131153756 [Malania oleifera]|uniref:uncharacterized protein LOC131153756 n=1 Tax=Malania oleifera TaxID=397392 RepID=UPI0025AE00E1|nr:uncharacterized protein LOC131153756 [Malania oleifera]
MGTNSKVEGARARKSATEVDHKNREAHKKEEQYWRDAEDTKSHASKKHHEDIKKRTKATAQKAKACCLAEHEEKSLEKSLKKLDKKASHISILVPKVTEAEPFID